MSVTHEPITRAGSCNACNNGRDGHVNVIRTQGLVVRFCARCTARLIGQLRANSGPLPIDRLFQRWLSNTTCDGHKSIVWRSPCERFAVFKHDGHAAWVGVYNGGSAHCRAYFALVDVDEPGRAEYGYSVRRWYGRWSKERQAEVEKICVDKQ